MDVSRRQFVQVGTVALATLGLSGSVQAQQAQTNDDYRSAAHLVGTDDARPAVDSDFFDTKSAYAYLYEARDTGTSYYIDDGRDSWLTLSVSGSALDLVPRDLSSLTPEDGRIYRHDGSSSITADGSSTSATGYYCYSDTDSEFKTVVTF